MPASRYCRLTPSFAPIAGANAGDGPFAITVTANWDSCVVSDAKIYKDLKKDGFGRLTLARAIMRRSVR
jgi:hypothetical protein